MQQETILDVIIFALAASNCALIAWALGLREQNWRLRKELYERSQWNWQQLKRWRN